LETRVEDLGGRGIRVTRELERLADALLREELVDLLENLARARGLRLEGDELHDDDDEAEHQARCERPTHPAGVCPVLTELLLPREIRGFQPGNLEQEGSEVHRQGE